MKDYEAYRGIYCSLCKALGKNYGVLSRFTLSYDFVFLALLRLSTAEDGDMHFEKCRCSFNPFVRCNRLCTVDRSLEYSADVAVLLLYGKIKDNIKDEKGIKKLLYRLTLPAFSAKRKKAAGKLPELSEKIDKILEDQQTVEAGENLSIDACCHPSATALSEIASFGIKDEAKKRIYGRIGYCIGKWVYLADALDDYKNDRDRGRFNPFLKYCGGLSSDLVLQKAICQMNSCISEAAASFELLNIRNFRDILKNILYEGLPSVQREISQRWEGSPPDKEGETI